MKKNLFFVFMVLAIIIVGGIIIYLVKQGKISPLAAGEVATLALSPTSGNHTINSTFNVNVILNTNGQATSGTDLVISYNPLDLEVQDANTSVTGVQIQPGTLYPLNFGNIVNTTTGKIGFAGIINPGDPGYTGTGVLATITFKALRITTTQVNFDFTLGSTIDSNVTSVTTNTDILASVTNASFSIVPQDVPTTINLNLQGRTNHSASAVDLKIYQPGTSTIVYEKNDITLSTSGSATFTITGVPAGNYDYRIKVQYFLTKIIANQSFLGPLTLALGTLKGGDLNNDNIVNSLDFSNLTSKWGQNDPVADINKDGVVNTIDFSILNSNWFVQGT